jgi:hypothetical protein
MSRCEQVDSEGGEGESSEAEASVPIRRKRAAAGVGKTPKTTGTVRKVEKKAVMRPEVGEESGDGGLPKDVALFSKWLSFSFLAGTILNVSCVIQWGGD